METTFNHYIPSPTQVQQVQARIALLKQCDAADIIVSIFGGYGLDALYGRLTRDHQQALLAILKQRQM